MDKDEEYRELADAADVQARAAKDTELKKSWLEVAKHWRQMAGLVERLRGM